MAGCGVARQVRDVTVRLGLIRRGEVSLEQGRCGAVCCGKVRKGVVRQGRRGALWLEML